MFRLLLALAAALAVALTVAHHGPGGGMRFRSVDRPQHDGVDMFATGEIKAGDFDRFMLWFDANVRPRLTPRSVVTIMLDSGGGNIDEALKFARWVQVAPISTNVGRDGECASACVLIFASGRGRYAEDGAHIGVHQSVVQHDDGVGVHDANAARTDAWVARLYRSTGAPKSVVKQMLRTPPSDIYWLTKDELRAWGVKPFS